jgi:hypothetical protein
MRYSARALPPYAHVPGATPHPRRDARGHSHGLAEPAGGPWAPGAWRANDLWLHAADLFNEGYWWECHEALEGLWRAARRGSPERAFVQGLVLVAAAYLNRVRGKPAPERQAERGLARMAAGAPSDAVFMGLDVAAFAGAVRADFVSGETRARIRLELQP